MTPRPRALQTTALVCGALLALTGGALLLRTYVDTEPAHHDMVGMVGTPSMSTGADAVGLIGTLLITQGVLLVLAGLFVLQTVSGRAPAVTTDVPSSPAQGRRPAVGHPEGSVGTLDVVAAQVVTIGGGLGSFALVDRLRIAGAAPSDVVVVGTTADPTARFAELCRSAGLSDRDRLRSDSSARMDNIWGFPGYAASEAHQRHNPMPVLRTVLEPVSQPYTPTVGLLVDGVRREAARIGWGDLVTTGEAYRVTGLPGGGYLVLVRREGRRDLAIQTRWVHLALGSAGPDTTAEHHELVRDLVEEGLGELNELGRLRVDDGFCVSRSGSGGIVASGMTVTGPPLAPADSFLGLQSAALTIARTLADFGIGHPLTPLRSLRSWWTWMEGSSL